MEIRGKFSLIESVFKSINDKGFSKSFLEI